METLHKIHDKLIQAEERRRLALSGSDVGIWDWWVETDELIWDDGMFRIYDIAPGDFANNYEAWKSLVHPDDYQKTQDSLLHCVQDPQWRYFYRFRIYRRDRWRYVVGSGNAVRREEGSAIRMVGINILEPENFDMRQVV